LAAEPYQLATLRACTRSGWLAAIESYRTVNPEIAIEDPQKLLSAMCSPNSSLKACSP
jgi:hypothetical protein